MYQLPESRRQTLNYLYDMISDEYHWWEILEEVTGVGPVTEEGYEKLLEAKQKNKSLSKKEIIKIMKDNLDEEEYWSDEDNHVSCFSYPDCEEFPTGCEYFSDKMGIPIEEFGHKG